MLLYIQISFSTHTKLNRQLHSKDKRLIYWSGNCCCCCCCYFYPPHHVQQIKLLLLITFNPSACLFSFTFLFIYLFMLFFRLTVIATIKLRKAKIITVFNVCLCTIVMKTIESFHSRAVYT